MMARVMGVAALLYLVLNGVAVPPFGALGAAVATALSMAGWNNTRRPPEDSLKSAISNLQMSVLPTRRCWRRVCERARRIRCSGGSS